jgi:hypothetical protein
MSQGAIQVEGIDYVCRQLRKADAKVRTAAVDALQAEGWNIISEAVSNIRQKRIWNTGLLAQSGKSEKNLSRQEVSVGFFGTENKSGYAEFVENGRRAGKFPPVGVDRDNPKNASDIAQWVHKKLRMPYGKELNTVAFLIARKIARQGTEPHPFFKPALEKRKGYILRALQNAVNKVTRDKI